MTSDIIIQIVYTFVALGLKSCHDIGPRAYHQGKGHSVETTKICVMATTPYCTCDVGSRYFTQLFKMTQGFVTTSIKGHIQVQGYSAH